MKYEVAFPEAMPPFRNGDSIMVSMVDALFTVPLSDMLHAYELDKDPEAIKLDLRFDGHWGDHKLTLRLTGTLEVEEKEVPDHLVDLDPAMSHLASTVRVLRMVDKETRALWAAAEPWEPTAEQEPASDMFWRYCEDVAAKLADMSIKDALHSTATRRADTASVD